MSAPGTVAVVGGGVVGASIAYALARRGVDVRLLERERIAAGASFGNAGTISAGHPPLNKPGRIPQAMRQMVDPRSPLYVPPRWDPGLWAWLTRFARYCTRAHVEHAMSIMAPLGKDALEAFAAIMEREEIDCGYRADGYWAVCDTDAGLADAREEAEILVRYGYAPEVHDEAGVRDAEPALGPVRGGVFYPEAGTLDPYAFVQGLVDAARRHGARVEEGREVREVRGEGEGVHRLVLADGSGVEADAVVLATGPFSLELAAAHGVELPVQPGKGYHRDLPVAPGGAPALRIACVLHETSVFCTPLGDVVRLAGTMEFSGLNHDLNPGRLEQLTAAARRYFPGLGPAEPRSEWCGLRPVSVDGLPIVGPVPGAPKLIVATGHGMLGLTLGPVTGELVADWLLEGGPEERYRGLAPERFL